MRIVCPTCSAAYEVPDRMLGTGKKLRCARCANEWVPPEGLAVAQERAPDPVVAPVVVAPPPVPAAAATAAVAPVAVAAPRSEPALPAPALHAPVLHAPALHADAKPPASADSVRPSRLPVLLALGGSALVLVGLIAAAFVWRGALMQAWPPSQRLFGVLGLG